RAGERPGDPFLGGMVGFHTPGADPRPRRRAGNQHGDAVAAARDDRRVLARVRRAAARPRARRGAGARAPRPVGATADVAGGRNAGMEILSMGGYGAYVWTAYWLTFRVLVLCPVQARRRQ